MDFGDIEVIDYAPGEWEIFQSLATHIATRLNHKSSLNDTVGGTIYWFDLVAALGGKPELATEEIIDQLVKHFRLFNYRVVKHGTILPFDKWDLSFEANRRQKNLFLVFE